MGLNNGFVKMWGCTHLRNPKADEGVKQNFIEIIVISYAVYKS